MANPKEKKEKSSKGSLIVILLLLIISIITSIFAIYEIFILSNIEDLIRYIVIVLLVIVDIILIFRVRKRFKRKTKGKRGKKALLISFMIAYSIICALIGCIIFYLYGKLSNVNKDTVIYSSSLVVLANNQATSISDISDFTIGVLNNVDSPDGYIIPQEIVKENKLNDENEIVSYEDYTSMITDLYLSEIDAALLPTDYPSLFSGISGYENIKEETKIVISKEKEMKKAETSKIETASSGKDVTEPFTMLLMGIDSTDEVLQKNAVANGDTLILITFNPKTLNATMLSIPRDSYVPIACWSGNTENKITHAAGYGNDCMMRTIENYFDVNIDYYAKINFKGLVKLVDALGGVDIDVKQRLCTDDSSRGGEICIEPGYQTLNGEQALVYARNRKALVNGDFGRNQHQQEIIMALAEKVKTITSVSKFTSILDTVSNSIDTNLTTKQMLSFYNVGKDIIKKSLSSEEANLVNIQQLYLSGTSQMIYDERARMVLYNYVPNKLSRDDIVQAMKENLGLLPSDIITEFSFSINAPYEKQIIGAGPYKRANAYTLLPDFTGDTKEQATLTANKYGISIVFEGTSGTVVSQSYPANKRVDLIKGNVVLTLSGSIKDTDDKKDKDKDKDKVDSEDNEKEDTENDKNTTDDTENEENTPEDDTPTEKPKDETE